MTLKKFNLAALAVLTAPAVMIFEASGRHGLGLRAAFYAALLLGVVLLNQAMVRLGDERLDGVARPLAGAAVSLGAVVALLVHSLLTA